MTRPDYLSAFFIVPFLFGVGIVAAADAVKVPAPEATVLNGKWAHAFETAFNKKIHIYDPSVSAWGVVNYALFREGREGVLVGKDGWLFTKEEFDYSPKQQAEMRKNLDFIKQAEEKLAEKDVKLLVVMVPAKARIYDEHLGRYAFPSYRDSIYTQAVQAMRADGISVADPLAAMQAGADDKPLFLKTDTHWTPDGAQVAAETVAQSVRTAWPDLSLDPLSFTTVQAETMEYKGDLLRYLPLGALADDIGPAADQLAQVKTEQKTVATTAAADALFGEETLPVTLVGTSYSANPHWNFAGYLEETLQTGVLNAAQEGQGPFETMKKYLADGSFAQNPPELVIWEIPERYLPVSYNLAL